MDTQRMRAEMGQELTTEGRVRVAHDGKLAIAYGGSRFETSWKNRTVSWSSLLTRLSTSQQTGETHAEYMKMPKERQDRIKDIGGFVGGHLTDGRRSSGSVASRQILTLDVDNATKDTADKICEELFGTAFCVYSTHKHTADRPRLRLIVPLDREVGPDAYEAIARKIAERIGMDYFDDSTYQPARLMYWPSNSVDVEPVFFYQDAAFLSADGVLAQYPDWTDVSYWPESSRMSGVRKRMADKQGNPTEKPGLVGAFCRTYTVTEAIRKFLPEIYTPTSRDDRWTYAAGSTAAGLVIYDGDLFAFSNHGTDPAGGQLCNAFDLVRIHRFGAQDEEEDQKKPITRRESYRAMQELVREDPLVRAEVAREKTQEAAEDFAADPDWRQKLRISDRGLVPDSYNAELILENDEHLQGIRFNEMSGRIDAQGVPWSRPAGSWRDADDAQLYQWLVRTYDVQFPKEKFTMALTAVADRRRFHPVKEYLDHLPAWDGVERVETILIDYLDAEDTIYTREAARCCLTAAVARVYEPGIKFDSVLIIQGPQAIGKSTLFSRLGGKWYSDNLSVTDMRDKTGAEKLQGFWILELSELTGMRRAEVEAVKGFISRQEDIYRAAYGRNTQTRPRQCVIVGSTNDDSGFLRDVTGNRRFWPIKAGTGSARKSWNLTQAEVDQIWAEAKVGYQIGDSLLLSPEAEAIARDAQREAMEQDDRQGIVEAYLERLLPEGWDEMDSDRRLLFLDSDEPGVIRRQTVSVMEIWVEALHGSSTKIDPYKDSRAIGAIMARIPGWAKTGERKYISNYGRQRIYRRL